MRKPAETRLRTDLTLFDATAISLGAIIGGGIFVVTGIVAGLAGSALVVSILLASVVSLFTALSFVELVLWAPAEGGGYEFACKLISPFAGFMVGWMWIVANLFSGAAVSLGFAHYLASLFPSVPLNLAVVLLCFAFTILNYFGIEHSARFNNFLVVTKIAILLLFVGVGVFHFHTANLAGPLQSGRGILYGAYYIFFAFAGFARVTLVAEEVKEAKKTVSKAIILSLAISAIIYVLVGTTALGLAGAGVLAGSKSPLSDAIKTVGNPVLVYLVSAGGLLATASVLLTSILGVSRMMFAMSRRSDLPAVLGRLHRRFKTPDISVLLVGVLVTALALFFDLTRVVVLSTFASLFYYAMANFSALRLASTARVYPRLVPGVGLGTCLLLFLFVPGYLWPEGLVCLLAGVAYYWFKEWIAGLKAKA